MTVDIRIDEAALQTPIPVLSIQPLVENAIKHGVARNSEPGYVRISGGFRGGGLQILVENSSDGPTADSGGGGVGLRNIRRRLEICYGSAAELQLASYPEKAIAELRIPLATANVVA